MRWDSIARARSPQPRCGARGGHHHHHGFHRARRHNASTHSGATLGLFHNGGTPLTNDITSISGQATHNDLSYELIYERGLSGNLFLVAIDHSSFTSDFAYGTRAPALSQTPALPASDRDGHTLSLTLPVAPNGADLIVVSILDNYVGSPADPKRSKRADHGRQRGPRQPMEQ